MAAMTPKSRKLLVLLLPIALAIVGWRYADTFATIAEKWRSDAAFSHGLLIVPISLWLAWRKRAELASVPFEPSWWGVAGMAICVAIWVIARGTGVLVVEQLAAVAMVPAAVLAVWGVRAALVLVFPLAFLFFAVPFGQGLVPALMQVTADIGTSALRLSGVPVFRSNMFISIPSGEFEVARTCSGLNYFITGLVLGTLYAYLSYTSWKKRLLCIAAFVVVPIVANGLRVYFTILVSYLTDMRYGPGTEHVTFGRIFFIVVMLVMFWIGSRWRDEVPKPARSRDLRELSGSLPTTRWTAILAYVLLAALAPLYLSTLQQSARQDWQLAQDTVWLPEASGGWTGPESGIGVWRPSYDGAAAEQLGRYRAADGSPVDVYIGSYAIGATRGAEMIHHRNRIFRQESNSLVRSSTLHVELPDRQELPVLQMEGPSGIGARLVWRWFVVGDQTLVSPYAVKFFEALALLTREAATERVVVLSTPAGLGARERLESFAVAHARCVGLGFAAEACGK